MGKLTAKRRAFCEAYARLGNATAAATAAGYAASSAYQRGYELMQCDEIHEEISRFRAIHDEKFAVAAADILRELAAIAMTDIGNVATWGLQEILDDSNVPMTTSNGDRIMRPALSLVPSRKLTAEQRSAVKRVSKTKGGTVKVELHDRVEALYNLGRHMGLFVRR